MSRDAIDRDDFFVGYLGRLPAATRVPIVAFALCFLAAFIGGALALSASQSDPGDGGGAGQATLTGVIYAEPYPHLRTPPSEAHPEGRTWTLNSARGKRGVQDEAAQFDGQTVEAAGFLLRRGDVETLQVGWRQGAHRITPVADDLAGALAPVEPLGRWRITGEICDGKCYLGVMRPGRGLAHKACANLCIRGGAPAVFVTNAPVEGETFLLLASPEGARLPDDLFDLSAKLITLDGALERHGDLLIFKADLATADIL